MQFKNLTALCILSLVTLAGSVQARDISMLTVEWAPQYGSGLPEQGLTTAIVKAAFKAEGHSSVVDFIPWARALREVEAGNSDVVMGAYHNKEREQAYIFSEPIYFLQLGLIARPGLGVSEYKTLRNLASYSIGISRGFANSEEFDAASYLAKHAEDISRGNLKQKILPESRDEIGQLAEAFHRMQTSLRIAFKRIYAKAKST